MSPNACAHLNFNYSKIELKLVFSQEEPENHIGSRQSICLEVKNSLPIVHTVRGLQAIQSAHEKGLRLAFVNGKSNYSSGYPSKKQQPLKVTPVKPTADSKLMKQRSEMLKHPQYAAYIIPDGVKSGTEVYVTDVIEDIVETYYRTRHRFNDVDRLNSSKATWDGRAIIFSVGKSMVCGLSQVYRMA